jgi:hypothetical protein
VILSGANDCIKKPLLFTTKLLATKVPFSGLFGAVSPSLHLILKVLYSETSTLRQHKMWGWTNKGLFFGVLIMNSHKLDQEDLINRAASAICERGWRMPALISLEICRPFTFVGGQILWIFQPMLGLLFSTETIGQAARLLEQPDSVDSLIQRLETTKS